MIPQRTSEDYADIVNLPRPELQNHQRMALAKRAAQFAPFAALTGYDEVIEETELRQKAEVMARDRMKD